MSDVQSECHNTSISPVRGGKEGEMKCDVCGNGVTATGARVIPAPQKPNMSEDTQKEGAGSEAGEGQNTAAGGESTQTGQEGAAEGSCTGESQGGESNTGGEGGSGEGGGQA